MNKNLLILPIIAILIIIAGGIYYMKNEKKLGGENELILRVNTDKNIYSNNTKYINVTLRLKNICSEPVIVERRFDLGSNIMVHLISPSNKTLTVHVPRTTHIIEKIYLNPNEEKKFEFNLLEKYVVYENMTNYNWNEKGIYTLYGEFNSLSGDIIVSNKISFEYN